MDVGGASGNFIHTLMLRHKELTGTVLDLPHTGADAVVSEGPGRRRTSPEARPSRLGRRLRCAHPAQLPESLTPGGRILVAELIVDQLGPPGLPPLMDLNMMTLSTGRERSRRRVPAPLPAGRTESLQGVLLRLPGLRSRGRTCLIRQPGTSRQATIRIVAQLRCFSDQNQAAHGVGDWVISAGDKKIEARWPPGAAVDGAAPVWRYRALEARVSARRGYGPCAARRRPRRTSGRPARQEAARFRAVARWAPQVTSPRLYLLSSRMRKPSNRAVSSETGTTWRRAPAI